MTAQVTAIFNDDSDSAAISGALWVARSGIAHEMKPLAASNENITVNFLKSRNRDRPSMRSAQRRKIDICVPKGVEIVIKSAAAPPITAGVLPAVSRQATSDAYRNSTGANDGASADTVSMLVMSDM